MKSLNTQQLMFCALLWTLVTNQLYVTGNKIYLQTLKQSGHPYIYTKLSSYGYEIRKSTCIMFEYTGCSDAGVGLMEKDDYADSKMYEIFFGAWGNEKSFISLKFASEYKATKDLSSVVHCNESRKFKVGWKDGDITAYRWTKPCKWEVLMSWHNTLYSVKYIGVTTGVWANGDWIIFNEECHVPINRNTLWENDIKRKDTVFSAPMFSNPDIDSSHQCAMLCQRYADCCYYTYNGKQRDCGGYSDTSISITSNGTQLWMRY